MKSLEVDPNFLLLENVLRDVHAGRQGRALPRDLSYVRRRFSSEGYGFLCTTLPNLGKSLLEGLEEGRFHCPTSFARVRSGTIPKFLSGLFHGVFELDGSLRPSPDAFSIQEILQICMLFYKLELPIDDSKSSRVIDNFKSVEKELQNFELPDDPLLVEMLDHASDLIHKVLEGFDPKDIRPKHGPGAVATGEKGNGKYAFERKYQHLHEKYPYYEYFSPSLGSVSFLNPWYKSLKPSVLPIAKVVLVPKDSRGPRLISMEPLEIQWIQQGLASSFVRRIETHPLTRGCVNFEKQSINRSLAEAASITRDHSTIDLKDASDRVSLSLFRRLFPKEFVLHAEACRSVATRLPDGSLQALRKFAPMGSALCFPVMALTLWALSKAIIALAPENNESYEGSFEEHLEKIRRHRDCRVWVYGDDMVVPTDHARLIFVYLPEFGLKINESKSYYRGFFRESCGGDYYRGVLVTPLRCKQDIRKSGPRDPSSYRSLVALQEAFFNKGFWNTVRYIRSVCTKTHGFTQWVTNGPDGFYCPSSFIAIQRNQSLRNKVRWNGGLQRYECRIRQLFAVYTTSKIDEHGRLLKGLVNPSGRWVDDPCLVAQRYACVNKRTWSPI